MENETINQIKEFIKEKQIVSVNDVKNKFNINYHTALITLMEMEISRTLKRIGVGGGKRTFKFWKLNVVEDEEDDNRRTAEILQRHKDQNNS